MRKNSKKKLIFGLGSGRCGTASLTSLLSHQDSTLATHELFPVLPWDSDMKKLTFRWTQMDHQAHLYDYVFDAGLYYFSYVQPLIKSWTMHEYARERYDIKFICLKREKEKVVNSFLEKFKRQKNNPLQEHNDPSLVKNEWDTTFPKYSSDLSLREAVGFYYDDYYEITDGYEKMHPGIFRTFNVEDLNNQQGVKSILEFVGYQDPKVVTNIQKRKH